MGAHKVRIDGTLGGYGTKIFVDGKEVHGVKSVTFKASTESLTTVTLEFYAEAEIITDAVVKGREHGEYDNKAKSDKNKK